MLCRLAVTVDFIGALIKPMLLHIGEVSALKEFRIIVDILPHRLLNFCTGKARFGPIFIMLNILLKV